MTQRIIALAGKKGSGKDTLASLLYPRFERVAFADAVYREVVDAYCLEDASFLRERTTKETPLARLCPICCDDSDFVEVLRGLGIQEYQALSPRQVLQYWGTEYRQKKDGPYYWVDKVLDLIRLNPDVDYCVTDMRFPHEYSALFEFSLEEDDVQFDCVKLVRELEDDVTSTHISETALEGYDIFTAVIVNPEQDPQAMVRSLKSISLV